MMMTIVLRNRQPTAVKSRRHAGHANALLLLGVAVAAGFAPAPFPAAAQVLPSQAISTGAGQERWAEYGLQVELLSLPHDAYHPGLWADRSQSLVGEVATLAINALLGGLTAGVLGAHGERARAAAAPRGFLSRFADGALGGSVVYVGKRIVVGRWAGAGLLGREIGAVGASMVSNAAVDAPLLSEVVLPAGPVRVYARFDSGVDLRVKLDLAATVVAAYAGQRPGARLDIGNSISAGAPVFFTPTASGSPPRGMHGFGVVMVEAKQAEWDAFSDTAALIVAHESVHVLQHDFTLQAWGIPAQRWLLEKIPGGDVLHRYVDLGLHSVFWVGLNAAIPYDSRPWEWEAYYLSSRKLDDGRPAGS